jgi:LacI family transcriptional regulator
MPKSPTAPASLGDIARAAGVSRVTACYVMRNHPGPSQKTRDRILEIAQRLGYKPDARIGSWMAKVRDSKKKELLPVAWLSTHSDKKAWDKYSFLSPYLRGASVRALQLGYRVENIWAYQEGIPMRRVSQIVRQRGIEGVIITHPVRHFHLDWNSLAAVSLEGSLLAPRLHHVMSDLFFKLLLGLKMARRFGYRRIGICLDQNVDRYSYHACRAAALHFHASTPKAERVAPLFYIWDTGPHPDPAKVGRIFKTWVQREEPDVVVGHNSNLVVWAEAAGYRVPQDMGVVHIATDDDVSDWAGISSRREQIGAAAAEWVISLLQNRQFGVPETAVNMVVRGTWHGGRTLIIPKPKN